MLDIIYTSTVLIPELICEKALCDMYEETAEYKKIPVPTFGQIIDNIVPELVVKADHFYYTNARFKKGITSDANGKQMLAMWFKHWSKRLIKEQLKTIN